jgi:hypothetical protein
MNYKAILENYGLKEGVDFTITPSGFDKIAKTRIVDQEIVHAAVAAKMNGETVIEPAIPSYTETVQVTETYYEVFPSEMEMAEIQKNIEIAEVDIVFLLEAYLADKTELRDYENDSINIVNNQIKDFNFKNIPCPTRDQLHALVAGTKNKLSQEKINAESLKYLADTDYLIIRELDAGIPCPAEIKAKRAAARAAIIK